MNPIKSNIKFGNGKVVEMKLNDREVCIEAYGKKYLFENGWIYPGFIDAHGHLTALGEKIKSVDLSQCASAEECVELAVNSHSRRGEWLTARGWNNENWENTSMPCKELLDRAFPDTPVSFVRIDGHAVWVNSFALRLAGIGKDSPEPYGGAILRDDRGEPSGILLDNAINLISRFIPGYTNRQIEEFILAANEELIKSGITAVHDMDVNVQQLRILKKLDDEGKLKVKVFAYAQAQNDEWLSNDITPYVGNKLNVRGVKFYTDGALGSFGAALSEPYSDKPETRGLLLLSEEELFNKSKKAIENGFDIATHAIGDRANSLVVRVYKKLRETGIAGADTSLRIEHAQIILPEDMNELAKYDIIASVQPVHCLSDAQMAQKRLSDRVKYSYPWNELYKRGVLLVAGSDFPIESHSVLKGIDAFVNRIPFDASEAWLPEMCLPVETALEAYTRNTLIATKVISPDKTRDLQDYSDFTILDTNLTAVDSRNIIKAKVLATIVNGEIVYCSAD